MFSKGRRQTQRQSVCTLTLIWFFDILVYTTQLQHCLQFHTSRQKRNVPSTYTLTSGRCVHCTNSICKDVWWQRSSFMDGCARPLCVWGQASCDCSSCPTCHGNVPARSQQALPPCHHPLHFLCPSPSFPTLSTFPFDILHFPFHP